jgi:hypothetical protein
MADELNRGESFLWGCLGAILPELIRLYKIVTNAHALPDLTWPYFIISVIFIVAAGGFTVAWKPESPFKAIWVGVSFPVLVSAMIQAAPSLPGSH